MPICAVVPLLSHVRLFAWIPWNAAHQASLFLTISQSLPKFKSIESVMPSNLSSSVIPFSCPQSLPASGSFPMSHLFASGDRSIGASASAQSFQWIFSVISFRIDWFDPLTVQETLKESYPAPQFESTNSSALSLLYGPTLTSIHDITLKIRGDPGFRPSCLHSLGKVTHSQDLNHQIVLTTPNFTFKPGSEP